MAADVSIAPNLIRPGNSLQTHLCRIRWLNICRIDFGEVFGRDGQI